MSRVLRNILRFPARTIQSLRLRATPGYDVLRQAKKHTSKELPADLTARLCAVPGNTSEWQCRLLYYLAATTKAEGCLFEIGAFKGKSTAWLSEAARRTGRRLVSIDPHLCGSLDEFTATVKKFDIASVATIHQTLSHDVGKTWSGPIAMLWIDGGHDYAIVRQDIDDFAKHVAPGGYIVLDDVNPVHFPGVVRAISETLERDPCFEHLGTIKTLGLFRRKHAGA
ncbi:MAG: class I SAM-dependent methyltransferase [Planctomycetes bacterium]|nr:class I SAM-dependent methyltransferase [Planctomycetota bacterium]